MKDDTEMLKLYRAARQPVREAKIKLIHRDGQEIKVLLSVTIEEDDKSWEDVWIEGGRIDCDGKWTLWSYTRRYINK